MLKKGQIIKLEHKAKQFVVLDTTEESVQIQFVNGRSYEVCRDGRIFGCDYKNTGERILLEQSTIKRGYKQINIQANSERVNIKVHRLVALCFLANPNNLPNVNHKDENPANNNVDNLEWCTQRYNVNYSIEKLKSSKKYMNARLTKDKVKSMLPNDVIFIPCDTASEVDSAYQTALQAKREMGENGNRVFVSKSNVTLSVVVRTVS